MTPGDGDSGGGASQSEFSHVYGIQSWVERENWSFIRLLWPLPFCEVVGPMLTSWYHEIKVSPAYEALTAEVDLAS